MSKLDEAKQILKDIGMPTKQQNDNCGFSLLALAKLSEKSSWNDSTKNWLRIHDIIQYTNNTFNKNYKENTRESFRKSALHHFRNAGIIIDSASDTNSGKYSYCITDEFLSLIKTYNTPAYKNELSNFLSNHETLIKIYASKKEVTKIPIKINGIDFLLSGGAHNELQKDIILEFASRFAQNSICLYLGDTTKKDLINDTEALNKLGFSINVHNKMPDVILYKKDSNWLYFIEAVASSGPMTPERIMDIEKMTENVNAGKIYVTAFPDFKMFKKWSESLAWETEVWISEMPDHMIHLNGDKFLGPRKR